MGKLKQLIIFSTLLTAGISFTATAGENPCAEENFITAPLIEALKSIQEYNEREAVSLSTEKKKKADDRTPAFIFSQKMESTSSEIPVM